MGGFGLRGSRRARCVRRLGRHTGGEYVDGGKVGWEEEEERTFSGNRTILFVASESESVSE